MGGVKEEKKEEDSKRSKVKFKKLQQGQMCGKKLQICN